MHSLYVICSLKRKSLKAQADIVEIYQLFPPLKFVVQESTIIHHLFGYFVQKPKPVKTTGMCGAAMTPRSF